MNQEGLRCITMTPELLPQLVKLCAICVGENLYTESALKEAMASQDKIIFALVTPDNELVAYIYLTLIDFAEAQKLSNNNLDSLKKVGFDESVHIGNVQSIGVAPAYRKQHLSIVLVKKALRWFEDSTAADIAFAIAWNKQGEVPMARTFESHDFKVLTIAKKVWYNKLDLICPVCKGRCKCDATIYYKRLAE